MVSVLEFVHVSKLDALGKSLLYRPGQGQMSTKKPAGVAIQEPFDC
jgi:hypothetical protein